MNITYIIYLQKLQTNFIKEMLQKYQFMYYLFFDWTVFLLYQIDNGDIDLQSDT